MNKKKRILKRILIFFFIFLIETNQKVYARNGENFDFTLSLGLTPATVSSFVLGEKIFFSNCNVCHAGGNNIIIPEKNLKKDTLESNGMNTIGAIMYQVINGKNGMPAFGGRLTENEIEEVAKYVIEKSLTNFEN
jgi:cytochrome c6